MKILYIILFFIDFTLMIYLSFLLLRMADSGHNAWSLLAGIAGVITTIGLLFCIITYFSRLPLRHDQ
jgi:hypothetical protein